MTHNIYMSQFLKNKNNNYFLLYPSKILIPLEMQRGVAEEFSLMLPHLHHHFLNIENCIIFLNMKARNLISKDCNFVWRNP